MGVALAVLYDSVSDTCSRYLEEDAGRLVDRRDDPLHRLLGGRRQSAE